MCIDHISYTDSATRTYVQDGTCTSLGFHGDYDEPRMRIQTVSRQLLFHCMDTHFLIPCVSWSIVWWCYSHLLAGFIFFSWRFRQFQRYLATFSIFFHPFLIFSTVGKAKELLLRLPRLQVLDVGRCSWALQNCVKNKAFFWKLTSTWTVFWYVLVYFNWIIKHVIHFSCFFWGNGWSRWSRCRTILLEGGDLTPNALTSACSLTQLQSLSLDGMAALEESFLRIGCCVIRHSCKLWFMISPQKVIMNNYYECSKV